MKRRILCVDYGLCNFHNLRILAEAGHEVFVTNTSGKAPHRAPTAYYKSLGITLLDDLGVTERESVARRFVKDNRIDTIINSWPKFTVPNEWKRDLDYIGLSEESAWLECRKWWTRQHIDELGVKLPKLLDKVTAPCVVKPIQTSGNNDSASIVLNQNHVDWVGRLLDVDPAFDYYIEEYISDNIETNVEFVVSGGKWSIYHHQQVMGEDDAKIAGNFTHWTRFAGYKKLSGKNLEITLDNAKVILDWVATLGGDYLGQITGLIKDGEWYFCEINSRPEQSNSLPYFITGDEWLEAMHGKPEIIGDSYGEVQKVVLQPDSPDVPYPFHLHEKYGVNIPCGLDILAGKHRLSRQFRKRSPDKCIGIIVVDRKIPTDFIDEIENNSKYSVSHCFL